MNTKLILLALSAAVVATACEKENNDPSVIDPEVDLVGDITEDRTLESGNTYTITGGLHVKAGATLTIQPGVTIIAKDDDRSEEPQ